MRSKDKIYPLTLEDFEEAVNDVEALLFRFKSEMCSFTHSRASDSPDHRQRKTVSFFGRVDGTLIVYIGSEEIYRGKSKTDAIDAYNKAVGV